MALNVKSCKFVELKLPIKGSFKLFDVFDNFLLLSHDSPNSPPLLYLTNFDSENIEIGNIIPLQSKQIPDGLIKINWDWRIVKFMHEGK